MSAILGLRTVTYPVSDLALAKAWYADVLDVAPYFDEVFYVGFNVGGFELGLVPDGKPGADGATAYWGVTNADAAYARLLQLGGAAHAPPTDVGEGIRVATVLDPFGNQLGIIENPHIRTGAVR